MKRVKTTPKDKSGLIPLDAPQYVILQAVSNTGTIVVNGKSGTEYKFVGFNPVLVLADDAPDLLAMQAHHRPCCTGEPYTSNYFTKVE